MARACRLLLALLLCLALPMKAQDTCGLNQITSTTGADISNLMPAIDAAGNRIAFVSNANLVGANANGNLEVFLWDAFTGFSPITSTPSQSSLNPAINAAGTRIAFESTADPLGTNADADTEVFLWDSSTGLIQITNNTVFGSSGAPSINAAGDRIALVSLSNLTGGNADGNAEIFLWSSSTGLTQITNTTSGNSLSPSINAAGNRIAFVSTSDFTGFNLDGNAEIFLWDSSTGFTQITDTSVFDGNSGSPAINATGDRIAFESNADIGGGNPDGASEIFLWDASTGFTQITNTTNGDSVLPAINAVGNRIAFRSDAPLLANVDQNSEIFLWDASTGITQITNTTGGNSDFPAINAAGDRIAFHSDTDPLGTNADRSTEIFLYACPRLGVPVIPAVSPLGLAALAALLGLAAAWTFRRFGDRENEAT